MIYTNNELEYNAIALDNRYTYNIQAIKHFKDAAKKMYYFRLALRNTHLQYPQNIQKKQL